MKRRTLSSALKAFWGQIGHGKNRMEWLRNCADWHVETDRRYIHVRRAHPHRPVTGLCFCCRAAPATQQHHVIQVQHGGRNVPRNLVGLCRACHRKIHPWMGRRRVAETQPPGLAVPGSPRLVRAS